MAAQGYVLQQGSWLPIEVPDQQQQRRAESQIRALVPRLQQARGRRKTLNKLLSLCSVGPVAYGPLLDFALDLGLHGLLTPMLSNSQTSPAAAELFLMAATSTRRHQV